MSVICECYAGTVHLVGPATKEEKIIWDQVQQDAEQSEDGIAKLKELLIKRLHTPIGSRMDLPEVAAEPQLTRIERIIVDPKELTRDDKEGN